jgi:hypothetical protein
MKKLAIIILALISLSAFADTYVRGYTKQNGTYVEPHYRSSPNGTTLDNYSTKGNVNPYTGQVGTVNPNRIDATPYSLPSIQPIQQQELIDFYK